MSSVPDEIAVLVRGAAMSTPVPYGDTDAVYRRARRYRRRRAGLVACVAVIVALSATAVPVLAGGRDPYLRPAGPIGPPTSTPSASVAAAPAQRLLLTMLGGISSTGDGGKQVGIAADRRLAEVLPDGSLAYHGLPAGADDIVAMPDGGFAALVTTDLMPGVERPDGPSVEGVSIKLVVLAGNGRVLLSREVRIKGEEVSLLGAAEGIAYLARAAGVVAHDLATGKENVVLPPAVLSKSPSSLWTSIDLTANRLAVVHGIGNKGCQIGITELRTGAQLPIRTLSPGTCIPDYVRLSPDGQLAAVAYLRLETVEKRVTVLDLTTGTVLADQPLGTRRTTDVDTVNAAGMAWSDARTLRVAVTELPEAANRIYQVGEVLRVLPVTTP